MKRLALIFTLLCALMLSTGRPADLVWPENAQIVVHGDSLMRDGDNNPPITAAMFPCYLMADIFSENPDKTNLCVYIYPRSGSTMNDQISAFASLSVASLGYRSNSFPHYAISQATGNGNLFSNAFFLVATNLYGGALRTTNGTAMTNEGGWCATANVQWIGLASPPDNSATGGAGPQSPQDRMEAMTNGIGIFGLRSVDVWTDMRPYFTNQYLLNGGYLIAITNAFKNGHLLPPGEWNWFASWKRLTTTDTNIATCQVNWDGTIEATNHQVVSGATKTGNTLTFTQHCDRMPPGFDWPSVDPSGAVITNDCTPAWRVVRPDDENLLHFDIKITGLPDGFYNVIIDGVLVSGRLPGSALANGWNMFTNTAGPYWRQRQEVLGRCRDIFSCDRATLVEVPTGDGIGYGGMGSFIGSVFPANHGDSIIAACNDRISALQTNSTKSFAAIRSAAIQTNHTVAITLDNSATISTIHAGTVHWGQ
jgi:hypothetical protein